MILIFALSPGRLLAADDRLVLVDGSEQTGSITAISSTGRITLEGGKTTELQQLRSVSRTVEKLANPKVVAHIHTIGGGRILASRATLDEDACTFSWALSKADEKLKLPFEAVRAICFAPVDGSKAAGEALQTALKNTNSEQDRLLVKVGDGVQALDGLLHSVDDKSVVFERKDQKRTLPRSRIYAVVLAGVAAAKTKDGQCLISLRDGSTLFGTLESLADGQLKLIPAGESRITLRWSDVAGFSVRSDRIRFLSEMTPTKVVEQAIVGLKRHWRRNQSVDGRTLTLGKKQFKSGLGVHSYCALSYDVPAEFNLLTATIGIDAEAAGKGDCLFIVLADGKEKFRQRVRAADGPFDLRVNVSGAKQITLIVEPGADLDFSDHADWCDARLIKAVPAKPKR
ncbi:MAG: NPCBM/NEW2 domain-containing protein [Planctomycetes bacterium]|nr:NPCBM/NEW2 domain-containing protein [Planctomycetota bacterium]